MPVYLYVVMFTFYVLYREYTPYQHRCKHRELDQTVPARLHTGHQPGLAQQPDRLGDASLPYPGILNWRPLILPIGMHRMQETRQLSRLSECAAVAQLARHLVSRP